MKYILCFILSLLTFSCGSFDFFDSDEVSNVISVHAIVPNQIQSRVVREIEVPVGEAKEGEEVITETKTIKVHPLLHAINIQAAQPFSMHGNYYGLRLKLNEHGRNLWYSASSDYAGQTMCLCVDGEYKTIVQYEAYDKRMIIKLYCRLTEEEAEKISKTVKSNYRILNDL